MFKGSSEATSGDTNMVLGDNFPILWTHKLRRGGSFGELHRLHNPSISPYAHLQKSLCSTGKSSQPFLLILLQGFSLSLH